MQRVRLKFHQGFVHSRVCGSCNNLIARSGERFRCAECRLSVCAVGRNRDTYSLCSMCAEQAHAVPVQPIVENVANCVSESRDKECEPVAEESEKDFVQGMSPSLVALREQRYLQSRSTNS